MRHIPFAALLIALVALVGACAEDQPALQAPQETAEATAQATAEATAPATAPADQPTVAVADSDFGKILVNGEGKTLYVFLRDADGKSNCNDACAQTWPPLTVDGFPSGSAGVDAEVLGTTKRADGNTQVTYFDRPLYTYSGDQVKGDTTGQGIGDNWYVVGTDGEPIKK